MPQTSLPRLFNFWIGFIQALHDGLGNLVAFFCLELQCHINNFTLTHEAPYPSCLLFRFYR